MRVPRGAPAPPLAALPSPPPAPLVSLLLVLLLSLGGAWGQSTVVRVAVRNVQTSGFDLSIVDYIQQDILQRYGTNVLIVVEEQPSDPDSYASLIRGSYLPNNAYDIYELSSTWASEFEQDFVDISSLDIFPDLCSDPSNSRCDYTVEQLQTFKVNESNVTIAVPWYNIIGALFYRADMLERYSAYAGVTPPPYSTYEELISVAKTIMNLEKTLNNRSNFYGWLFEGAPSASSFSTALSWIYSKGGGTIVDSDGTVDINNEGALEAIFNAILWVREGVSPVSLLGSDSEQVTNLFRSCQAPFMANLITEYNRVLRSPIRCRSNRVTAGITQLPGSNVVNSWGFGISANSSNRDIAAAIIQQLTTTQQQIQRAGNLGFLPTRNSAYGFLCNQTSPWFGCFAKDLPLFEPPSDQTGAAFTNITTYFSRWMNSQYTILPRLDLSTNTVTTEQTEAFEQEIKAQLSSNLVVAQEEITSILYKAKVGDSCGLTNGVSIECQKGLSCTNGKCFDIVPVIVGTVVPIVALILLLLAAIAFLRWKRKKEDISWSSYSISWKDLEIDEKPLGRGSFGVVYHGRYRNTEVAIKKLLFQDDSIEKEFRKETQTLVALRHPNIILFMGACFEKNRLAIVTEFMPNGTLHSVLYDTKILIDLSQKVNMLKDICGGMAFLHAADPPMFHRDLKSPNILVAADFRLKVADFGLAAVRDSDKKNESVESGLSMDPVNFRGTLYWTAPEVMRDQPYTDKSDVYSFGIICWEILTREKLYPEMHPLSVGYKVMVEGLRPKIPSECPEMYRNIMETCWHENPDKRPSFQTLLENLENLSVNSISKYVYNLKDFKGLQSQIEAFATDPSIELDEISAEVAPPTGEITMVIADVAKWEVLWEDNRIPMVKVIGQYMMILRREMRRRGGFEVNTEERICKVAFQDPLSAVEWCLRVQLALLEVDWPKELLDKQCCSIITSNENIIRRGLLVAMGVNTGEASMTFNHVTNRPEYSGPMVLKTASICKIAQYGQVLVANSTYQKVQKDLESIADIQPVVAVIGDFTFSDLQSPETIVQILPQSISMRNFGNVDIPSKPHLVRGISDFHRSSLSDMSLQAVPIRMLAVPSSPHLGKSRGERSSSSPSSISLSASHPKPRSVVTSESSSETVNQLHSSSDFSSQEVVGSQSSSMVIGEERLHSPGGREPQAEPRRRKKKKRSLTTDSEAAREGSADHETGERPSDRTDRVRVRERRRTSGNPDSVDIVIVK